MSVTGYVSPARYYCRACAPEGLREPYREVSMAMGTYHCDACGARLAACVHKWGEWRAWWSGGEFRCCDKDHCEAVERREGDAA